MSNSKQMYAEAIKKSEDSAANSAWVSKQFAEGRAQCAVNKVPSRKSGWRVEYSFKGKRISAANLDLLT